MKELKRALDAFPFKAQIGVLSDFIDGDRDSGLNLERAAAVYGGALTEALSRAGDSSERAPVGRALRLLGRRREAAALLRRAAREAPDDARALAWAWEAGHARGGPLDELDEAVRMEPGEPLWLFWRAAARAAGGSRRLWSAALRDLERPCRPGGPRGARLLRAEILRRLGRGGEALSAAGAALKSAPGWPAALRLRARLLAGAGDLDAAFADCEAALMNDERLGSFAVLAGIDPNDDSPKALFSAVDRAAKRLGTAWAYALRGDLRRAPGVNDFMGGLEDLRRAVDLAPGAAWSWAYYARALAKDGAPGEAEAALSRAETLAPGCGWLKIWRGESLRRRGNLSEALLNFDAGLSACPDYEFGYAWRGGARRQAGDAAGALKDLGVAAALLPKYPWTLYERAQALRAEGRLGEALTDITRAHLQDPKLSLAAARSDAEACRAELRGLLARRPEEALARAWLGRLLFDAGRRSEALKELSRARRDAPEEALCAGFLGEALLRSGRARAAERELRHALSLSPGWPSARALLGEALLRRGKAAPACRELDAALSRDGSLAWAWTLKAAASARLGKTQSSRRDAARALALNPADGEARALLEAGRGKGRMAATMKGAKKLTRAFDGDDERLYLACLIGLTPDSAGRLRQAAAELAREAAKRPGEPAAFALRGRALTLLGDGAEGRRALSRAVELDPGSASALVWRGQSWLAERRLEEAYADLDRAIAVAPAAPWARVLRAVCLLAEGRFDQARPELAAAAKSAEARRAVLAVEAVGLGQNGQAREAVNRLAGIDGPGWLLGLRGMLKRGADDLPGSLDDLNAALERERSPWLYSQRADVLNRTGFYKEALKDLESLAELMPASAEPHAHAANIYFDQAFYKEALESIDRAVRLEPKSPSLLSRRARFLFVMNRLNEAQKDLDAAERLDPGSAQTRFERLMVGILRGKGKAAQAEIEKGALPEALGAYLLGLLHCRARRYAQSETAFRRAAECGDGSFSERSSYFALVAKVLSEKAPEPRKSELPDFYLCGIGIRHPFQTSVEALRALARCRVIYNNIGDPQIMEFLSLFPGEIRAVRRVWGGTAFDRAELIVKSLKPGETTGFVTRIHPFIYRKIANKLVNLCRSAGRSFTSFGAVSLTEVLWGLAVSDPKSPEARAAAARFGLRVFDISYLNRNPDLLQEEFGTVVYAIAGEEERRAVCRLMVKRFGQAHRFYVLAGSGDKEDAVVAVPGSRLEAELVSKDSGALLYAPPSGAAA